jgi:hypothetical protein
MKDLGYKARTLHARVSLGIVNRGRKRQGQKEASAILESVPAIDTPRCIVRRTDFDV